MPNILPMYHVLLLGDSITQFGSKPNYWATLLQSKYEAQAVIHNYGMSSANTIQVKGFMSDPEFEKTVPKHIDRVYISLGSNDACWGHEPESKVWWQGVPVEKFVQNYLDMYKILTEVYQTKVSFIITHPLKQYGERDPKTTEEFADALRNAAIQNNINYVDIRTKMQPSDNIWADGLHLNDLGNKYLYEVIAADIGNLNQFYATWGYGWEPCENGFVYNKHTAECEKK